jgi:PPOX class probable F420-dependent enzyme
MIRTMTTNIIPNSHLDLIAGPVHAVLTTISPAGKPENTVVWCSWDGEHVLVNTVDGRRKANNVRANPYVALTAIDPENPLRWIDVRGLVLEIADDVGNANIDAHTRLYTEHEKFFGDYAAAEREATEKRIILKIKPERVLVYPH